MKEFFRKKIVGLKRSPQIIPLLFLVISCLVYTCSLTPLSSVTAKPYGGTTNMDAIPAFLKLPGMYMFIVTLLSILICISFLSAFKGGKRNNFIISVVFVMLAIMVVCDILFISCMNYLIDNNIAFDSPEIQIINSISISRIHIVFLVIDAVMVTLVPVFKKLLSFINTEVEDEYDKLIEQETEEEKLLELQDET